MRDPLNPNYVCRFTIQFGRSGQFSSLALGPSILLLHNGHAGGTKVRGFENKVEQDEFLSCS